MITLTLVIVLTFTFVLLLSLGLLILFRTRWDAEAKRVRDQIRTLAAEGCDNSDVDIFRKKRKLSDIPLLDRVLGMIPLIYRMDLLLQQADIRLPVGIFVLLSALMGLTGLSLGLNLSGALPAGTAAAMLGSLPFLWARSKKNKRLKKFESQLPEALDLLAKALKAGHAFSAGLNMIAHEFEAPISAEFERILSEVNLGRGIDHALKGMTERVDCPDLKFFTISVIIQRETGGNLAEILERISGLIRERFRLKGRIKTLSAEGRISAIVIICIPIFVACILQLIQPRYFDALTTDPVGKTVIAAFLILMIVGIFTMKKMIAIKI